MKRLLAALLAALMLPTALASCAEDGKDPSSDTSADTGSAVSIETETEFDPTLRENARDNLPHGLNLDGLTVTAHLYGESALKYDVGVEEETGDVLIDEVYYRNLAVSERLNAVILSDPTTTTKWQDFSAELNSVISAGDDAWQIVFAMGNSIIQTNRGGLFQDLANAAYLDWSQPWWWNEAMDEVSLDGQIRKYLVGDLALSNFQRAGAFYFNKAIYSDVYGSPEEMYKTVMDGDWTLDKLTELSLGAYHDANGNGNVDEGDVYGTVFGNIELIKHAEYSFDISRYFRDEQGYPTIEYDVERSQLAVEKMSELLYNTLGSEFREAALPDSFFAEGNVLFYPARLLNAFSNALREMESDYGIIPYPKLDDTQPEYENLIHNSSNYVAVPVTCAHTDEVCAVLEALCAESYRSVIEVFFEIALKAKYSRDSYSGQCIDLLRDISKKHFTYEYDGPFGAGTLISKCIVQKTGAGFASSLASTLSSANKKVENAIAELQKETAG